MPLFTEREKNSKAYIEPKMTLDSKKKKKKRKQNKARGIILHDFEI